MVDLSPVQDRSLQALAALVVAETSVGEVGELEGGVQLAPHAVPVQLLLLVTHRGPELTAQHNLNEAKYEVFLSFVFHKRSNMTYDNSLENYKISFVFTTRNIQILDITKNSENKIE